MTRMHHQTNSEAETVQLGADIGLALRSGDLLFLSGDLGAGKTVLARAIIRSILEIPELEVASPTYTICQTYHGEKTISHYDLYRLSGMDDLYELGWEEALENSLSIMEWPQNCFDENPAQALVIEINQIDEDKREFCFSGNQNALDRVSRSFSIRHFLEESGEYKTSRKFLSGDASTRSYELIGDGTKLLMNSPAMPDGPPIKDGKPYSQIAHLAEDVSAFVGVANILKSTGIRVPEIYAQDLDQGLLLTEHLGDEGIIDENRIPIPERYLAAVELLVHLHQSDIPYSSRVASDCVHHVPSYDRDAMMIEVDLLRQWYLPHEGDGFQDDGQFEEIWDGYIARLAKVSRTLIMRDYHSPNILWLEGKKAIDQVGVIDFQDAMVGPEAYDLASLAQDARVDVSEKLEQRLVDHYIAMRLAGDQGFDEVSFRESYAIMAAQRVTKILGIFIRLDVRDGKPHYRAHLPRMKQYLQRSLRHPVMKIYETWLKTVIEL